MRVDATDIAQLMAESDFAMGAGGITAWERACLGLPTAIVAIASNQWGNARQMAFAGGAFLLGSVDGILVELPVHFSVMGEC